MYHRVFCLMVTVHTHNVGGGASRNKWTVGIPWLGEKVGICKIVVSYDHRLPALLQLNPFIKKQESLKGEMEMLSL